MDGTAVVYVHGLWMVGAEGLLLQRRLWRQCGYQVHLFHYRSVHQPMEQILAALRDLIARLPAQKIHLLGHSLGGVVILEYLSRHGMDRPGRVVFLGSPVMGSRTAERLARFGLARPLLGRAVCEQLLEPRKRSWTSSRELGVIAGTMPLGFGKLVMRFDEPNDGTIAVSETRIPGASAYLTLPVSHMGLLFSERVAREAGTFLQHGRFEV